MLSLSNAVSKPVMLHPQQMTSTLRMPTSNYRVPALSYRIDSMNSRVKHIQSQRFTTATTAAPTVAGMPVRNYRHSPSAISVDTLQDPKFTFAFNLNSGGRLLENQCRLQLLREHHDLVFNAIAIEDIFAQKGVATFSQSTQKKYALLWKLNAKLENLRDKVFLKTAPANEIDQEFKEIEDQLNYVSRAGKPPVTVDADQFVEYARKYKFQDNLGAKNRGLVKSVMPGVLYGSEPEESPSYYLVDNSSNIPMEERERHYSNLLVNSFTSYGIPHLLSKYKSRLLDLARRCDELKTATVMITLIPSSRDLDKIGYASGKLGVPDTNPSLARLCEEARDPEAMRRNTCSLNGPHRQGRLVMNKHSKGMRIVDASNPGIINKLNLEEIKRNSELTPGLKKLFPKDVSTEEAKRNYSSMQEIDNEHDEILDDLADDMIKTIQSHKGS